MIYTIKNRSFIILSGTQAWDFMQSMCTCDIYRIKTHGMAWGAILSPQGKFLYGFFAFCHNTHIYLDVHTDILMECGAYLSKYAVNTDTHFAIGDTITVHAVWQESPPVSDTVYVDPRTPNMGHRFYVWDEAVCITPTATEATYHHMRIQNGVTDLDTDVPENKAFALELRMDAYNGVDFDKGCYIGQEVTARMHWRQALKKSLVPLWVKNAQVGDILQDAHNARAGTITFVCSPYAMAMVPLGKVPVAVKDTPVTLLSP